MKLNKILISILATISFNAFAQTDTTVEQYENRQKAFEEKKKVFTEQKRNQLRYQNEIKKQAETRKLLIKKLDDENIQKMAPNDQAVMTVLKNSPTADYRTGMTLSK